MSEKAEKLVFGSHKGVGGDGPDKSSSGELINCSTLINGLSHEMRTHMNSIVAFSFLLNSKNCTDEERTEFGNYILNSCEQLMFLFDNFFDSAIIDRGNSKAEPKLCTISSLINELMSEVRTILKRRNYEDLVLILEDQVDDREEVYIDTYRVIRVLRNLFLNAVNNTQKGYIKIGCKLSGDELVFYVIDTGTGFQKSSELLQSDDLQGVLLKYNDTPAAVNMMVVKKLINILEGKIWLESTGASGTAVYFSVPLSRAETVQYRFDKINSTRIAI